MNLRNKDSLNKSAIADALETFTSESNLTQKLATKLHIRELVWGPDFGGSVKS